MFVLAFNICEELVFVLQKCSVVFLCNIILDAQFMLLIMASNSILVLLQEDKRLEFCIRPSHRAVSLKECFISSAGLTGELQ
jgi:hypothetical protein